MKETLAAIDRSGSIAITSTLVVAPNPRRKWVTFVNEGANKVNLRLGAAAAVNTGIPLLAGGGSFVMDMATLPWYGSVNAIATAAPGWSVARPLKSSMRTRSRSRDPIQEMMAKAPRVVTQ